MSTGVMIVTRAAASSTASGMPSSRRQISATASALLSSSTKPGCTARARSVNSCTASLAIDRLDVGGARRQLERASAATPARPRRRAPHDWWRGCARRGSRAGAPRPAARPPATRCSQLSSTSTSSRMRNASITLSASDVAGRANTPSVAATTCPSSSSSCAVASSHNHAPSGKRGGDVERDLDRDAALPDATDAGDRDQPRREQRVGDRLALDRAPDERGQLAGEVAGNRVERAQRRELARQARRHHLEDPLGSREVGQPVLTEVDERDLVGQRVAQDLLGGVRHHDLLSVRRSSSPGRRGWWRGRSSRRRARPRRRCGGPSGPAARRAPPRSRRRGPLRREGGVERRPGGGEHRVEAVAGGLHHHAAGAPRPRHAAARRGARAPARIAAGCCSQSRVEPSRSVNRNVTVPDGSSGTLPPRPPDARMIARPADLRRAPNPVPGRPGGTPYPRRHARRTHRGSRARARAARARRRSRSSGARRRPPARRLAKRPPTRPASRSRAPPS